MSVDPRDLHAMEVELRDSRNMGVIMALARLTVEPRTQDELHRAVQNLGMVQTFFVGLTARDALRGPAAAVFSEHAQHIQKNFRAAQSPREVSATKERS